MLVAKRIRKIFRFDSTVCEYCSSKHRSCHSFGNIKFTYLNLSDQIFTFLFSNHQISENLPKIAKILISLLLIVLDVLKQSLENGIILIQALEICKLDFLLYVIK